MTPDQLEKHLLLNSFDNRQAAQGAANRLSQAKSEQHRPVRHNGRWFLQNAVRQIVVTPKGEPLLPETDV